MDDVDHIVKHGAVPFTVDRAYLSYMDAASCAFLFYDVILTSGLEIQLIWPSRWDAGKLLFILARYATVLASILVLIFQSDLGLGRRSCVALMTSESILRGLALICVESILTLRTIAVHKNNRRITMCLTVVALAHLVPELVMVITTMTKNDDVNDIAVSNDFPGCVRQDAGSTKNLLVIFILMMTYEFIITLSMSWPVMTLYRRGQLRIHLVQVIYQDAIVFYCVIFVVSLFNVITLAIPDILSFSLTHFVLVIHAVLGCRVVLHIREQAVKHQLRVQRVEESRNTCNSLDRAERELVMTTVGEMAPYDPPSSLSYEELL